MEHIKKDAPPQGHPFLRGPSLEFQERNMSYGGHVTLTTSLVPAGAQGIKSPVCSVGICTAMSLKQNKLLQRILKHIEAQHCGSGEVELEDAVDPCKLFTKNYQHDHGSLTAKLKLVETQLEALDPSWSKWQLSTSMMAVPADGSESALLLSSYQLGFT